MQSLTTFEKLEHKILTQCDANVDNRDDHNSSPCTSYRRAKNRANRLKQPNWMNNDILYEPRHEKMCLRESPTRLDTNRPAQPKKLARVLKFQL